MEPSLPIRPFMTFPCNARAWKPKLRRTRSRLVFQADRSKKGTWIENKGACTSHSHPHVLPLHGSGWKPKLRRRLEIRYYFIVRVYTHRPGYRPGRNET
jgi:hypothetical protein